MVESSGALKRVYQAGDLPLTDQMLGTQEYSVGLKVRTLASTLSSSWIRHQQRMEYRTTIIFDKSYSILPVSSHYLEVVQHFRSSWTFMGIQTHASVDKLNHFRVHCRGKMNA